MPREMWEVVETKTRKTWVVKTKGGRSKRRSRKEKRGKGGKTKKEKTEGRKNNRSKKNSGRMEDLG